MELTELPEGLAADGHFDPDSPEYEHLLSVAADWLVAHGMTRREAAYLTVWHPGLVSQCAWIRDHGHGDHCNKDDAGALDCAGVIDFVQAHHDGARPVTVVHVPTPARAALLAAEEAAAVARRAASA